jgi:simple sugar transport system permease protein
MIILSFFRAAFTIMIPIFFAAIGGLFPALAGTLNIALEGLLLIGAFSSLAVLYFSGSVITAIACAILTSTLLAVLHSVAAFKLRANLFISGLAINLFSSGLCIVLSDRLFNTKGVVTAYNIPGLVNLYVITGLFLLLISWLVVFKTPFGYRLRACEKNSEALVSLGLKPKFYQTTAIIISGIFCGIGGSFLSLNLGAFVPGISSGRGWIALAVIFLGLQKPQGIFVAAFIFALAESFSNYAQGFWNIPADFILAFPFICALIVMISVSIARNTPRL